MHYIIYKTTNLVNGNFYIGYHSTNNLDDKYLGSGKLLRLAINKYNIDKFKKEILFIFDTKEEALLKEREVVNPDFIKRNDVYNVKYGGEGGWEHTWYDKRRYDAWRKVNKGWSMTFEKRSKLFLGKNNGMYGKKQSSAMKERMKLNQILDKGILAQRLNDYNTIEKKYGWKTKLARKWNISHTQVCRFIKKYVKYEKT